MVIAPLLVGALASGLSWVHIPLLAFWLSGYFSFFATSLWLKSRRKPRYWPPVKAYFVSSTVLGLITLAFDWRLIYWAPAFLPALGFGLWAASQRRQRELISGLMTLVGSALMVLVAYDAGGGADWARAGWLALIQFVYFGGTVFYVKSVIRERNNPKFMTLSIAVHLVSAVGMAFLSPWLGLIFLVLAIRAAVVPRFAPSPKDMGIGEIFSTVIVSVASLLLI